MLKLYSDHKRQRELPLMNIEVIFIPVVVREVGYCSFIRIETNVLSKS